MLSDEDLRRLQLKLTDMLKVFDSFCREHDINYVLAAGTLLGAVRHQGFIPWDDDIDLIMLPDEYAKFNAVCHLLPAPLVAKVPPEGGVTKILDVSRILETECDSKGMNHPFLDIFPVRLATKSEVLLAPLRQRVRRRHIFPRWHPSYWFWSLVRGYVRWIWRRRQILCSAESSRLIYGAERFANWTIRPEQLKAVRREEVRFEGECYPVPADTEGYLRIEYGDDFMTPHPPELRHYHIKAIHF